jgi:hypothetical protein
MRRAIVITLAVACELGGLATMAEDAKQHKTSQAFREQFVKDFHRIGTPQRGQNYFGKMGKRK